MKLQQLPQLFMLTLLTSSIGFGTIRRVPTQYSNIQSGIDAAAPGDTVMLADGVYTGNGNRDIDFLGKAIVVMSANGPQATVIDCEGGESNLHRGFYFHNGEGPCSVLQGVTIKNGYLLSESWPWPFVDGGGAGIRCDNSSPTIKATVIADNRARWYGGGVFCNDNSSPILIDNAITGNFVGYASDGQFYPHYWGGGISVRYSSPLIINNVISNNSAGYGGGINCDGSTMNIEGNTLSRNEAYYGAGIACWSSSGSIKNNIISYNWAFGYYYGGGVYCNNSSPTIESNTLVGNVADFYGVGYGGGIASTNGSSPTVSNSILWGNRAGTTGNQVYVDEGSTIAVNYSDVEGNWPGTGNISQDPLFVVGSAGEFYLSQISSGQLQTSPCVDAGDPSGLTIQGWTRTDETQDAGILDMGYHYGHHVNIEYCPSATGMICGKVLVDQIGLEQVAVALLDSNGDPLIGFDTVLTNVLGEFTFANVPPSPCYQVMIVVPLGYLADANPKTVEVHAGESVSVNFTLCRSISTNNVRGVGYWKHQFNVYVNRRGRAQETEAQLHEYISRVHQYYTPHFDLFKDSVHFEQWSRVLGKPNSASMRDKAKQHLATLVLNFASLKIGQYMVVTVDGRTAGDALTFASMIVSNGSASNAELERAKDVAENVNNNVLIAAGIVPAGGGVLYKETGMTWSFDRPIAFGVFQNYPNPFNPSTIIRYGLPHHAHVTLAVYNILGQQVAVLVDETQETGYHEVVFKNTELASGVYLYRLQAEGFVSTRKLLLLR